MIVREYRDGDEYRIKFQASQRYMSDIIADAGDDFRLTANSTGMTVLESNGEVLAMGGIIRIWEGRGQAWMFISKNVRPHMTALHRLVKTILINSDLRRIEATVDVGFDAGMRWMKMLGFEMEGYMKGYMPGGSDAVLFARVRR